VNSNISATSALTSGSASQSISPNSDGNEKTIYTTLSLTDGDEVYYKLTDNSSGNAAIALFDPNGNEVSGSRLSSTGTSFTYTFASGDTSGQYEIKLISLTGANTKTVSIDYSYPANNIGALNVVMRSDLDASGAGSIFINGSTIFTNNGHLWLGGGSGNSTWNSLTVA
jgi:hypothetical protein